MRAPAVRLRADPRSVEHTLRLNLEHRVRGPRNPTATAYLSSMDDVTLADVGPNFGAVNGGGDLRSIVGALLTYGLIVAVLMLVICSATWALASQSGSWHTAQKAKTGMFVALGGATLTGAALTWTNWLLGIGAHL